MLLAIDTSTAQIGVGLFDGVDFEAEATWISRAHHTTEVAPAVQDLMKRTGCRITDIEALGIALGPGSFTALRVGLAFAKGLAVSRSVPIVGIPTLDVLAAGVPESGLPLAAVLQAGRGRVAVGWYRCALGIENGSATDRVEGLARWLQVQQPRVMSVDGLAKSITKRTIVAGELSGDDRQRMARKRVNVILAAAEDCVRHPSKLAKLAWIRYRQGFYDNVTTLAPIYLHATEPVPE